MKSPENFLKEFTDLLDIEASDAQNLSLSTKLSELAFWDSLAVISVIIFLDTNYGRKTTNAEIRECVQIKDLFELATK